MFFTANSLQNPHTQGHLRELFQRRFLVANMQQAMLSQARPFMSDADMAANALAVPAPAFWQQLDQNINQVRQEVIGMEILDDLMRVQTVLPIGKTASMYTVGGIIADDVAVSIDGQAPFSFDMSEYSGDGDPIPVFTAGYGVNWRLREGLSTVGIDAVLDAGRAKTLWFNRKLVDYVLNGNNRIQVGNYPGQGLRNHRNTIKLNLGAGGANINLATATPDQLIAFFTTGAFNAARQANRVMAYDVMWVSMEIMGNLGKPYGVALGAGGANLTTQATVLQTINQYTNVREIRGTYALTGNEFIAYVRRSDVVSPLVGMTTGVTPVPRFMPNENFNYQMMGAMGLRVAKDADGYGSVLYGSGT